MNDDLTLSTIGGGSLDDQFQDAWLDTVKSLSNPAADPTAPRVIQGRITIKANDALDGGRLLLECWAKATRPRIAERPMALHMERIGVLELREYDAPKQGMIPPTQDRPKLQLVDEGQVDGVCLSTIGGGALEERFQLLWPQLLENLADPNTESTDSRVINFKITVKAEDSAVDRGRQVHGFCKLEAWATVASPRIITREVYFALADPDRVVFSEHDLTQRTIDDALDATETDPAN